MNATMMSQSEARLLRRWAHAGDADAFSEITRLYAGMVYGTCLRITGNQEHAADAAQETFYDLLKHARRVTGSLGGWLHQVAVRRAIDLVRRDAARRRHESAFATAAEAVETDQWADVSPLVDEAIGELEEDLRDIVLHYYLQGQSTVQIAAAKGVSQSTISRRVERALEQLRDHLRAKGVLVSATALAGLMPNATTSAPAVVLEGLGKVAQTSSGTAAADAAATVFSGLVAKLGLPVLIALVGVGAVLVAPRNGTSVPAKDEAEWGQAVEGVQARLHAKQTNWNVGATPRLSVDVRNQGTRHLLVQTKQMHGCEVEVDGQWFRRPANTREIRALPSPFPPGRQYDGIVVNLDGYWQVTVSQDVRRSRRPVPERLRLTPGQHTIRVAVAATADKSDPGKPVRAISNPAEIEIIAAPGAAGRSK